MVVALLLLLLRVALLATLLVLPLHAGTNGPWRPPPAAPDAPAELRALIEQVDSQYMSRHQPAVARKLADQMRGAARQWPESYDVQWRLARVLCWCADIAPDDYTHEKLAREGWAAAQRAVQIDPGRVEGQYLSGFCVGQVGMSVGVLTALREGLESKFKEPLLAASRIDDTVEYGGVFISLGRYKFALPWPLRSYNQSITYLRKGLSVSPTHPRGRVYLAESLLKRNDKGDREEALQLLRGLMEAPLGYANDPPEELRSRALATELIKEWNIVL